MFVHGWSIDGEAALSSPGSVGYASGHAGPAESQTPWNAVASDHARKATDVGRHRHTQVSQNSGGLHNGCVVECRICNREVALLQVRISAWATSHQGLLSNSIPLGSVNEYQLRLGRQRQVWLIPIVDERVGVQVKL